MQKTNHKNGHGLTNASLKLKNILWWKVLRISEENVGTLSWIFLKRGDMLILIRKTIKKSGPPLHFQIVFWWILVAHKQ